MLILLAEYLAQFQRGFNVFQYLTLRTILGVLTALFISLVIGPSMIRFLARFQIGQNIRDDGPASHFSKAGTPTMGGALIIASIAATTLLWGDLGNRYVWVVLASTVVFGAIGFVDDYRKLVMRNSKGLSAREKILWQSLAGLGTAFFLFYTAQSPAETELIVPFVKSIALDLGW